MTSYLFWLISLLSFSIVHPSETFSKIPIHSFPFLSGQRFAEIKISGKKFLGLIDTGSAFSMIRKDILDKIVDKEYVSESEYISINGNKYLTPDFRLPEVAIGHYSLQTIFKEEDENFWTKGSMIGSYSFIQSYKTYLMYQFYREAVIGVDLFRKFACVFDFPHSSIFLAKHITDLIEDQNDYFIVPFVMGKAGVTIAFETDLGIKKFLLDSAATLSLIRVSSEETHLKSKLSISDTNFGPWEFTIMNFSSELDDIEGILGIDFFQRNIIGFDFETKTAYIQTPKLGSKERFTYWLKSCFGSR
jgi:hypothetical protein